MEGARGKGRATGVRLPTARARVFEADDALKRALSAPLEGPFSREETAAASRVVSVASLLEKHLGESRASRLMSKYVRWALETDEAEKERLVVSARGELSHGFAWMRGSGLRFAEDLLRDETMRGVLRALPREERDALRREVRTARREMDAAGDDLARMKASLVDSVIPMVAGARADGPFETPSLPDGEVDDAERGDGSNRPLPAGNPDRSALTRLSDRQLELISEAVYPSKKFKFYNREGAFSWAMDHLLAWRAHVASPGDSPVTDEDWRSFWEDRRADLEEASAKRLRFEFWFEKEEEEEEAARVQEARTDRKHWAILAIYMRGRDGTPKPGALHLRLFSRGEAEGAAVWSEELRRAREAWGWYEDSAPDADGHYPLELALLTAHLEIRGLFGEIEAAAFRSGKRDARTEFPDPASDLSGRQQGAVEAVLDEWKPVLDRVRRGRSISEKDGRVLDRLLRELAVAKSLSTGGGLEVEFSTRDRDPVLELSYLKPGDRDRTHVTFSLTRPGEAARIRAALAVAEASEVSRQVEKTLALLRVPRIFFQGDEGLLRHVKAVQDGARGAKGRDELRPWVSYALVLALVAGIAWCLGQGGVAISDLANSFYKRSEDEASEAILAFASAVSSSPPGGSAAGALAEAYEAIPLDMRAYLEEAQSAGDAAALASRISANGLSQLKVGLKAGELLGKYTEQLKRSREASSFLWDSLRWTLDRVRGLIRPGEAPSDRASGALGVASNLMVIAGATWENRERIKQVLAVAVAAGAGATFAAGLAALFALWYGPARVVKVGASAASWALGNLPIVSSALGLGAFLASVATGTFGVGVGAHLSYLAIALAVRDATRLVSWGVGAASRLWTERLRRRGVSMPPGANVASEILSHARAVGNREGAPFGLLYGSLRVTEEIADFFRLFFASRFARAAFFSPSLALTLLGVSLHRCLEAVRTLGEAIGWTGLDVLSHVEFLSRCVFLPSFLGVHPSVLSLLNALWNVHPELVVTAVFSIAGYSFHEGGGVTDLAVGAAGGVAVGVGAVAAKRAGVDLAGRVLESGVVGLFGSMAERVSGRTLDPAVSLGILSGFTLLAAYRLLRPTKEEVEVDPATLKPLRPED